MSDSVYEMDVKSVQISPLVATKISSRCSNSSEEEKGFLLGLLNQETNVLEVTNCFPFKIRTDNENKAQIKTTIQGILAYYRQMNCDFEIVGFYSRSKQENFLSLNFIGYLFEYQKSSKSFVGLVYDSSVKYDFSAMFKAYELSPSIFKYLSDAEAKGVSDISFGHYTLDYCNILQELPIRIKSSDTENIASLLLEKSCDEANKNKVSDLTHNSKNESIEAVKRLFYSVDELNLKLMKQNSKVKSYIQQSHQRSVFRDRRNAENRKRFERNEPALNQDDDLNNVFGTLPVPTRLENLICLNGIDGHMDKVKISSIEKVAHKKLIHEVTKQL